MNIAGFEKIAKYLAVPLVLVGFVLMLVFGIHSELIKSGLLTQVSQGDSSEIIKLLLNRGFQLGMGVTVLGFALAAWSKYMDKVQVQQVNIDLLAEKVALKVLAKLPPSEPGREEAKKAVIEAVTALPKADAPDASINAALQELEQGDTAKAQAIFAEVLRSKEAEGKQANKEAAAAARHLGALAYMNNPKAALAAYQKAVELDPDNADGWNRLGILLCRTGELAQAEDAYRKVLALSEAHQDKEWQAKAYGNLGSVCKKRGELDKAEEIYLKGLELDQALSRKEGMAAKYGNLGNVYQARGELDKAEEMYRKSLEMYEALDSKKGMAQIYGNLGTVYDTRGELDKAEEMHRKALALNEALGHKEGMAANYGNLGLVYDTRGELDKAEEMHRNALDIHEALGHKEGMAINYAGLGNVYKTRGELDKAEEMYRKSLEISEALGLKELTANQYANLGNVYKTRGGLDKAEELWKKSLRLYQEMGAMQNSNAKKVQQWLDELAQQRSSTSH